MRKEKMKSDKFVFVGVAGPITVCIAILGIMLGFFASKK